MDKDDAGPQVPSPRDPGIDLNPHPGSDSPATGKASDFTHITKSHNLSSQAVLPYLAQVISTGLGYTNHKVSVILRLSATTESQPALVIFYYLQTVGFSLLFS